MNRALLVALREFRQVAATRGFWVILLTIPLILAVSQVAGRYLRPTTAVAYVIHDPQGLYATAIEKRFDLAYQREAMGDLAAYAQRWKIDPGVVDPALRTGRRWVSDREVEAFVAGGGLPAAQAAIAPRAPVDAPPFKAPTRQIVRAALPATTPTDQGPEPFGAALAPKLKSGIATPLGHRPLAMAIYIPADLGQPGVSATLWTSSSRGSARIDTVRSETTRLLRAQAIAASGVPPAAFARIDAIEAPLIVTSPKPGEGRDQMRVRSLLPLGLVYLLLVTVMITGAMLLHGVIEERSNKLLESVLACIEPRDLMYGKLLGLCAVGLTIVLFWSACAGAAAFAMHGAVADVLRPSLAALDKPWIPAALLFYFLAGYLSVSMIYLAIGAVSDSMQDAQAYLMPVIMVVTLPIIFMMAAVVQDPNGALPRILSWIPLYTPFAMMARLGSGVSLTELIGTSALLIAFLAAEVFLLGKIFQHNLLRTGQPAKLAIGRWFSRGGKGVGGRSL